ncbi:hypothetical protein [Arenimonas daejeonensis]|uniref:hypothetical protein n=1 Tax=Arenimonas daejeonensis TaxID=370777 RepID=UPI0011BD5550|nr:hypothetical protein [Arenimonas daejeonensis]
MIPLPEDIRLVFEDRPGYLYAQVTGPRDSHEITLAYWTAIAHEVRKRGAGKLMVFENLGDHEGGRDLPAVVDALIAMGLDRIQVAFVVGRVEQMAHMEHGEILALERGANGRVFGNSTVAEHWLRHGSH